MYKYQYSQIALPAVRYVNVKLMHWYQYLQVTVICSETKSLAFFI